MKREDAINLKELDRRQREKPGYEIEQVQTIRAGQRAIKVSDHPLDTAFARGVITKRLFDAGDRLRSAYLGSQSIPIAQYDGVPPPDSYGPRNTSVRQAEAAAEYAKAMRAVGKWQGSFLTMFCGVGLSAKEILNAKTKWDEAKAMGNIRACLECLADHFGY